MAITPGWKTNKEGEEEYFDKGAVMTPQVNPVIDARFAAGKAQASATDKVEWPTKVAGQTDQGM